MSFEFKTYNDTEVIVSVKVLSDMESEIERLKKELDLYKKEMACFVCQKEIETLKKENARLREVLEFYADKGNWGFNHNPKNQRHLAWAIENTDCGWCKTNQKFVGGRRARQVLAKHSEGVPENE